MPTAVLSDCRRRLAALHPVAADVPPHLAQLLVDQDFNRATNAVLISIGIESSLAESQRLSGGAYAILAHVAVSSGVSLLKSACLHQPETIFKLNLQPSRDSIHV